MNIDTIRKKRGMSIYELAQHSGVPYPTVYAICHETADIRKCQFETVAKLAETLHVSLDDMYKEQKPQTFTFFRCAECHKVKSMGQLGYIEDALINDRINSYYKQKDYPKALYVLSMLDYLSRINKLPLCKEYKFIRSKKLSKPLYANGIILSDILENSNKNRTRSEAAAIPEFKAHNIIEAEVLA